MSRVRLDLFAAENSGTSMRTAHMKGLMQTVAKGADHAVAIVLRCMV